MISIDIARDLHHLGNLIEEYKGTTGAFPRTLAEATRGRRVRLADPSGVPYGYDPNAGTVFLNPESKIVYLPVPEALLNAD